MKSTSPFTIRRWLFGVAALLLSSTLAEAANRVYPNPEAVEPLKTGSEVPSSSVTTVGGESVDLAKIVRETGALLVFYRGGW